MGYYYASETEVRKIRIPIEVAGRKVGILIRIGRLYLQAENGILKRRPDVVRTLNELWWTLEAYFAGSHWQDRQYMRFLMSSAINEVRRGNWSKAYELLGKLARTIIVDIPRFMIGYYYYGLRIT